MGARLLVVAAALVLAGGGDEEAVKKERQKLKGTWTLVSEVKNGETQPAEYTKRIRFTIQADGKWKVEDDGNVLFEGTSTLDLSKKPRTA